MASKPPSARWIALILLLGILAGTLCLFSTLFRRNQPENSDLTADSVSGSVRDEQGPVAEALVRVQGQREATWTDADGQFLLPRPPVTSARLTAWKPGYVIAGISADDSPRTLTLARLPRTDCEEYTWIDPVPDRDQPQTCGNCHAEIYREWSASGHAKGATNLRFLNLYDGSDWQGHHQRGWNLLADNPDGAGVCTACHAPTVSFEDPAYFDLRQAHGTAARGVHCDYCHKVADVANEQFGLTHGRFGLKLLRPAQGQLFFGPLDDVDRGEDSFAPVYRQSRYCASCHEGTVFGVPVYTTYSEWLESPAAHEGKQCQSCHMAPTGSLINFAPGKGGIPRDPSTLGNHLFFAGSQVEMLRRCVSVSVHVARKNGKVEAEIAVSAGAVGHRVPTGFVDRHLLLILDAVDPHSKPVPPESGTAVLPKLAGTSHAGHAGRLYAKQTRDYEGRQPVPFWRARPETVDTRLVPGQSDSSVYRFPGSADRVRVRLVYRRFWEETTKTKGWPDDTLILLDQSYSVSSGKRSAIGPETAPIAGNSLK
jgi:hypothetical protein